MDKFLLVNNNKAHSIYVYFIFVQLSDAKFPACFLEINIYQIRAKTSYGNRNVEAER